MVEKTPERLALEARAEAIKLDYPWNLGDDKLEARVIEAEAAAAVGSEGAGAAVVASLPQPETEVPGGDPVIVGVDLAASDDQTVLQVSTVPASTGGGDEEGRAIYAVLDPVRHDGVTYCPGTERDQMALTEDEARPLLDLGVIRIELD